MLSLYARLGASGRHGGGLGYSMMNLRGFKASSGVVAALSLTGVLALSACEERPYPTAAKTYAEAPKAAPLAGAPAYTPPVYAPAPPPAPAPQPTYSYTPPPPRAYDPPAIVAMAPIPNPGEPGSNGYYTGGRVHAHYATAPTYAEGYAPPPPRPVYHGPVYKKPAAPPAYVPPVKTYAAKPVATKPPVKTYAAKPATPPAPVKPAYVKPVTPPPAVKTYADNGAQAGAKIGAAAGAATAVVVKDSKAAASAAKTAYNDKKAPAAAPVTPAKVGQDAKAAGAAAVAATAVAAKDVKAAVAPAAKPAAPAPAPAAAPVGDRSTRLASLQSALTDAISKGAVLKAPERFTANQPADVTLVIPKAFADTLRAEAQKDGLSDAAASVNLTANLAGSGFSVTPDETQSQPLTVGQDTEFRWTVTAQPGATGPLHADVGADLLGGGSDTLALGSVQKAAGLGVKLNARVVGAAILVLILALVVVWLARGRGPSRSASARRASRNARGGRPLDMGTDGSASH